MTELSRIVRRKVRTLSGEQLVVVLTKDGIVFREPRRRTGFLLPYGVAFQRAAFLAVEADRRAKRAACGGQRGGRRS